MNRLVGRASRLPGSWLGCAIRKSLKPSVNRLRISSVSRSEWDQRSFPECCPFAPPREPSDSCAGSAIWRSLSLFAVSLLALAGCSTIHPAAGTKPESETVMVTYHVQPGKEAEFEALLTRAWETYRSGHLVYSSPHVIVRDDDGEGKTKYVEIFTWSKSPDHPPASVLSIWKQEQSLCESRDGRRGIEGGEVNLVTGK